MIFVSYSHADEAWRKRFETISKPLSRAESMVFWSDKNINMGEWETQIEAAMQGAVAAVLLVSDNFLASNYIVEKELPYLINANKTRGLQIIWAYLEPCDLKRFPQISKFQAMGELKAMTKMNQWEWKQTMLNGCDLIDKFLKDRERPLINSDVVGRSFPKISDMKLLSEPARRPVEVLVYEGAKWWRQPLIKPGMTTTKIYLGNESTKKGTQFTVVAITVDKPLANQTYLNLPEYRTKSKEFTLVRG
jgi:TIR domain